MKPQERVKAILKSKVEPTWKVLLIAVASYMSDEQLFIWAKPETLAIDTGLSRSTVMAAFAEMQARGIVTRADEGRRAKVTRIQWDILANQEAVKSNRGGRRVVSEDRTEVSDVRTEVSDSRTEVSDSRTDGSDVRTDRGPIIGLLVSDSRTRSDHGTHHHDPTNDPTNIHVPPEPTRPLDSEPPCLAPQQQIQASVQESTAKTATNTPPAPLPAGTASIVESPKKSKNSEAVGQIWSCFRGFHLRSGEKPPAADARLIETALKDWTADQLCAVIKWAHQSQHERAQFLREKGFTALSNLLVAAKIGGRLELAEGELLGFQHPTPDGVIFGRVSANKPAAMPTKTTKQNGFISSLADIDPEEYHDHARN